MVLTYLGEMNAKLRKLSSVGILPRTKVNELLKKKVVDNFLRRRAVAQTVLLYAQTLDNLGFSLL